MRRRGTLWAPHKLNANAVVLSRWREKRLSVMHMLGYFRHDVEAPRGIARAFSDTIRACKVASVWQRHTVFFRQTCRFRRAVGLWVGGSRSAWWFYIWRAWVGVMRKTSRWALRQVFSQIRSGVEPTFLWSGASDETEGKRLTAGVEVSGRCLKHRKVVGKMWNIIAERQFNSVMSYLGNFDTLFSLRELCSLWDRRASFKRHHRL